MVPRPLPGAVSAWTSQAPTWGSSQPKGRAGDAAGWEMLLVSEMRPGVGCLLCAGSWLRREGHSSLPLAGGPEDALERKGVSGRAWLQGPLAGGGASAATVHQARQRRGLGCAQEWGLPGRGLGPTMALPQGQGSAPPWRSFGSGGVGGGGRASQLGVGLRCPDQATTRETDGAGRRHPPRLVRGAPDPRWLVLSWKAHQWPGGPSPLRLWFGSWAGGGRGCGPSICGLL